MATKKSTSTEIKDGKVCAMLAYLLIGIIWYFVDEKMRKNNYCKYHVKQAIVLFIAMIAIDIVLVMTIILSWLIPLLKVAGLVFIIIGMMNANNGDEKELPFIGKFASSFKF